MTFLDYLCDDPFTAIPEYVKDHKKKVTIILIVILLLFLFVSMTKCIVAKIQKDNLEAKNYKIMIEEIDRRIGTRFPEFVSYDFRNEDNSVLYVNVGPEFKNLSEEKILEYLKFYTPAYENIYEHYARPLDNFERGELIIDTGANKYQLDILGEYLEKDGETVYNLESYDTGLCPHSMIHGVNGTVTYRCENICSEECLRHGSGCKTCLLNAKNGRRKANCCFEYTASTEVGWIGCPQCGDISTAQFTKWRETHW